MGPLRPFDRLRVSGVVWERSWPFDRLRVSGGGWVGTAGAASSRIS